MKVDHSPLFVSPKLSASSFTMPSRPMKRSRSRSRSKDSQTDRPLKRVSLAPVNGTDVFPQRPVFHTILPVRGFSQQKSPIIPADGYSMTPLWGPRPQSGTTAQPPPPYESQIDDDVRMDCDSTQRRSASPSALPPSSTDPTHSSSNPANAEEIPLRTPKLLANCPSLEMNEISPSVSQGPTSHIGRTIQPKRPRFTMGPRSDCEKCRAGVKGHWGHFT